MNTPPRKVQGSAADLSISDLAAQTGLTAATLRTWEARHGFPVPHRRPGGHRRYDAAHVAQVRAVLERRSSGMTLEAAIAQVATTRPAADRSVFAGLRRRHPALEVQTLRKRTLLALTRAMEDECCARAERPLLLASFQHAGFYHGSRERYADLARTARATAVLADFSDGPAPHEDAGVTLVHVPESAPLRREWTLVCHAEDYPACLAAWELPGQGGVADPDRRFEAVWTLDPAVVLDAARLGVDLVRSFAPEHAERFTAPTATVAESSPDLRNATTLLHRMVGYLDRSGA